MVREGVGSVSNWRRLTLVGLIVLENTILYFLLGLAWAHWRMPSWSLLLMLPLFVAIWVLEYLLPITFKLQLDDKISEELSFDYAMRNIMASYAYFAVGYLLGQVMFA